jgi:glycogen(starch) synthase
MRLLFLTNFFPPAGLGGYELWCREIAEGLRSAGHEVVALTSTHRQAELQKPEPAWVRRRLHLEMELASLKNGLKFFIGRNKREAENLTSLRQSIEELDPQILMIWGMWNLPRSLPALAEKLRPGRVVYYMGDYWPTLPGQFEFYWQAPARSPLTGIPKSILKPVAQRMLARTQRQSLQLERVIFPTAFLREELLRKGIAPQKTEVIYGAVDTTAYRDQRPRDGARRRENLSLLYAGRLAPDKGVHTAVEALAQLVHRHDLNMFRLSIVGSGEADYERYLRTLSVKHKVDSLVDFPGPKAASAMPSVYGNADIFLFTSIWHEPFGRVLVEAMASGVTVVGTATGGAAEILSDNENALLFKPGDAEGLAEQLRRLAESPELRKRLSEAGRRTALEKFDLRRMTSEIEAYLLKTLEPV